MHYFSGKGCFEFLESMHYCIGILIATAGERKMQPDYLAFNSMSFSNGANRDTELQVIVYQYWNTDEVVAEIEAEHNQINGTPTTLTINLHRFKWSFHNGYEPFYSTTINYD